MDVDILKTCSSSSGAGSDSSSSSSSMDMMAMMMQMEKFPELLSSSTSSDPAFYNTTTLTYPSQNDDQFSLIGTTTLPPIFSNIINPNNINVAPPPPPTNFTNNPYQQSMTPPPPPPQFQLNNEASPVSGRLRAHHTTTDSISLLYPSSTTTSLDKNKNSMAAMREMIFRVAVMQPIHIDPESIKPPKRRNVKISKDPQSVAARHRRERISERIRILQRLVPGGTKMDTASMLDEAIHYVKFLKKQVQTLEQAGASRPINSTSNSVVGFTGFSPSSANALVMNNYPAFVKGGGCHQPYHPIPMVGSSASKQQLLS